MNPFDNDPWSPLPTWAYVWRNGYAPALSTPALVALRDALKTDDPRLIQGITVRRADADMDVVCGACAVGLACWLGDGVGTPAEVDEEFARVTTLAGHMLGDPTAVRYFLGWFDETPRAEVIAAMLPEVERELTFRELKAQKTAVVPVEVTYRVEEFDPFAPETGEPVA